MLEEKLDMLLWAVRGDLKANGVPIASSYELTLERIKEIISLFLDAQIRVPSYSKLMAVLHGDAWENEIHMGVDNGGEE